ncbi:NUDIX hydrolase [Rhodopseudomonas palustris]|uniref:NUDIX hydrolase n=1 Tax=Rhodopseudomonas palustris TaxID=1076 RepID=UPI002ACDF6E1|nr:NUDIX hydrolase [Rhodopseudomonas palustris]WQG99402.1 NUDIX hydrolase [Rhodopseudomonas palustris]
MTPPAPPRHPQIAVSGAIFRDRQVLLVRRARAPALGLYSLPGGRVEYGETLHDALAREVAEETALTIAIDGLAGWRDVVPGSAHAGHYVILSFAARWIAGAPVLNDELDDAVWVAPETVGTFRTTEGLAAIVDSARRLIGT